MKKVSAFTLHNDRGQSILSSDLINWRNQYPDDTADVFGPVVRRTWYVDGEYVESNRSGFWHQLPDSSGFICFERDWVPDNCVLLDAYGKERMRLTVPWQLTKHPDPKSAAAPTCFDNFSAPYCNPVDNMEGTFGVTAWVENAGKFYFELDYHTGKFLWGREIRD